MGVLMQIYLLHEHYTENHEVTTRIVNVYQCLTDAERENKRLNSIKAYMHTYFVTFAEIIPATSTGVKI